MNDLLTPDKIWSDFSQYLRPDRFGVIGAKDIEAIKAMTFKSGAGEDSKGPVASAP